MRHDAVRKRLHRARGQLKDALAERLRMPHAMRHPIAGDECVRRRWAIDQLRGLAGAVAALFVLVVVHFLFE